MIEDIAKAIRDVPDFPKPGIVFKDITPILQRPELFNETIERMRESWTDTPISAIASIESRGFILGGVLANHMNVGFIPVRKKGKLPCRSVRVDYDLEYGQDTLEMHDDAVSEGQNVLIIDDLLATGGSAKATAELVEKCGGNVVGFSFIIELAFLHGRANLEGYRVESLIQVQGE